MVALFIFGFKISVILFIVITGLSISVCGQWQAEPKKCGDVCPAYYNVVCALHKGCLRTFASSCVMHIYNCKYQKAYRIIAKRACEFITNDDLSKLEL